MKEIAVPHPFEPLGPNFIVVLPERALPSFMAGNADTASVQTPDQRVASILLDLRDACAASKRLAHFFTLSRMLPETSQALDLCDLNTMSRRDIAICIWLAFDDPLQEKGPGRPHGRSKELVKKPVVFKETHTDGSAD